MEDRMSDFLCCAIPLFVILGGTALLVLFWRRLATRGYETSMDMDGAMCLKAEDGSLVFRRQTVRSWLYLVILASAEVGALAFLLATLRGLFDPETRLSDVIGNVLPMIGVASLLGAAIYVLVRSVRLPQASLDAGARVLRTGWGKAWREIAFSDISRVTIRAMHVGSPKSVETGTFEIGVLVGDEEHLPLGTVSGEMKQAAARARTITQWIADLTGAQVRQVLKGPLRDGTQIR
jgi:hypothetical protein